MVREHFKVLFCQIGTTGGNFRVIGELDGSVFFDFLSINPVTTRLPVLFSIMMWFFLFLIIR